MSANTVNYSSERSEWQCIVWGKVAPAVDFYHMQFIKQTFATRGNRLIVKCVLNTLLSGVLLST